MPFCKLCVPCSTSVCLPASLRAVHGTFGSTLPRQALCLGPTAGVGGTPQASGN